MDSRTLRETITAYAAVYDENLREEIYQTNIAEQSAFKWDPNKNVIAAKDGKLGIMDKGDPKSWRQPSDQEKGEIPLSSTAAFRKSKAGQKFIQQKDAAKKASATTLATSAAAAKPKPTTSTTPTAKPTATSSTTPTAKPTKIQQDVADLRRMQAASMMRQQNRNLPSGKIPTGDDLKPSTSAPSTQTPATKPTPTAPVNKARGSSKPGSIVSGFDLFDVVKGHLLGEGYADTEEAALVIMANMSEEWRQSIIEMNDFAAGGGAAKMKATGMTKDQVVALGKKNLASKPASSSSSPSSSSGKSTGSTPSDVVRDRLASRDKYRDTVNQAIAAGVRGPAGLLKKQAAQDQEAKFDAYQKKQRESGYYKTGYKNLPGTFEKG
jgi:hypothetical protein